MLLRVFLWNQRCAILLLLFLLTRVSTAEWPEDLPPYVLLLPPGHRLFFAQDTNGTNGTNRTYVNSSISTSIAWGNETIMNETSSRTISLSMSSEPDESAASGDPAGPEQDPIPPHVRSYVIHIALVTSIAAGTLGNAYPALKVARLIAIDALIRTRGSEQPRCVPSRLSEVNGEGLISQSMSISVTGAAQSEDAATAAAASEPLRREEAWWLIPIYMDMPPSAEASLAAGALLIAVLFVLCLLVGFVHYRSSDKLLQPSTNATPVSCMSGRRVLRYSLKWLLPEVCIASSLLWATGPMAMAYVIALGGVENVLLPPPEGSTTETTVIVAAGSAVLAVCIGVSFAVALRLPQALARSRFHGADSVEMRRMSLFKRALIIPRGAWSAVSTWDSDVVRALGPLTLPLTPSRTLFALVEVLITLSVSSASAFSLDCRVSELIMAWAAALVAFGSLATVVSVPFVEPWTHVSYVSVSALTTAAARVASTAPLGVASHSLSTSDALAAAAACVVVCEAGVLTGVALWRRFYRRQDALRIDAPTIGGGGGHHHMPLGGASAGLRSVRRRPKDRAAPLLVLPPEDVPAIGPGEDSKAVPLGAYPAPPGKTLVVTGHHGVVVDDWLHGRHGNLEYPDDEGADDADDSDDRQDSGPGAPQDDFVDRAADRAQIRRNPLAVRARRGAAASSAVLALPLLPNSDDDSHFLGLVGAAPAPVEVEEAAQPLLDV